MRRLYVKTLILITIAISSLFSRPTNEINFSATTTNSSINYQKHQENELKSTYVRKINFGVFHTIKKAKLHLEYIKNLKGYDEFNQISIDAGAVQRIRKIGKYYSVLSEPYLSRDFAHSALSKIKKVYPPAYMNHGLSDMKAISTTKFKILNPKDFLSKMKKKKAKSNNIISLNKLKHEPGFTNKDKRSDIKNTFSFGDMVLAFFFILVVGIISHFFIKFKKFYDSV